MPQYFKALIGVASGKLSSVGESGVTGRSQNVPIHLHMVNTRITYKSFNIFYIDPLSDLRPDLEASGCGDFAYVTIFSEFQILAN
jgi:hypothetical protein